MFENGLTVTERQ
jgi:hypothetical protein